jgi:hypothetical protein
MSFEEATNLAIAHARLWSHDKELAEKVAVLIARAVHSLGEQAEGKMPGATEYLDRAERLVAILAHLAAGRDRLLVIRGQALACLSKHHAVIAVAQKGAQGPDWSRLNATLLCLDALADADGASQDALCDCAVGYRNAIHSYGDAVLAQAARGEPADWSRLHTALARLDTLAASDGASVNVRRECAVGYRNAVVSYGEFATAQDERGEVPVWGGLWAGLKRLDQFADADDASWEIRLESAKGHQSSTFSHGHVAWAQARRGDIPDWPGMLAALARLDVLADADGAPEEVRLACATGYVNATATFGEVAKAQAARGKYPEWSGMCAALARLDALAADDDTSAHFRDACANGHANAAISYGNVAHSETARGEVPGWTGLSTALARLDVLADADHASNDVRLHCATGYMSAAISYGNAAQTLDELGQPADWSGLHMALARLDVLADTDGATQDIRLQCAIANKNAAGFYAEVAKAQAERGEAPDWSGLRTVLARLDALADTAGASQDIRSECAFGQVNAIAAFAAVGETRYRRGEVPDWTGLHGALARLDSLARMDDVPKLRRVTVEALSSADTIFRDVKSLADAEMQRRRLRLIGWEHPMDLFVQQHLEQFYPHLTYKSQSIERERMQSDARKFREGL